MEYQYYLRQIYRKDGSVWIDILEAAQAEKLGYQDGDKYTFSGGLFQRDALTDFLDEVRERCRFQYWFFGHYHENMVVEKEFVMLYKQIIRLK